MRSQSDRRGGLGSSAALLIVLIVGASAGCSERVLTITQADVINTAAFRDGKRGMPLELAIVCVHPNDLKVDANSRLAADSGITSEVWFRDCPKPGDRLDSEAYSGFQLKKAQIFLLTDERNYYGKKLGPGLKGAKTDTTSKVTRKFIFGGDLHNDRSVVYVFGRFVGPNGEVLPIPPAKFDPPGDFRRDLSIKIGVDASRPNYGQYIDNITMRHLGSSSEE